MHYGMTPYRPNPCGQQHHPNPYGPSGGYGEAYDYNPPSEYQGIYMPWGLPRHLAEEARRAEQEAHEKISGTMDHLAAYEMNPGRHWGAGAGYHDARGYHPGGGRYLEQRYLGRPPYDYHPGGGQWNRGFHPGAGYNANPPYKVRHHTEEFQCSVCGTPVYVGDKAYEDDGEVYCCKGCAQRARSNPPYYERNLPPAYGYGHLPYASAVGPGMVTPLLNPPRKGRKPRRAVSALKAKYRGALDGAAQHGLDSEQDMEIGDLQDMLNAAWEVMDHEQRERFIRSNAVQACLRWGYH